MGAYLYSYGSYVASHVKTKFEISGPGLDPGWTYLGYATTNNVGLTCYCPYYTLMPFF